jgi:di/tripeptidase
LRQAFIKDLHDAEESLTGQPHGLAWFYNAKARLPESELVKIARQGDADAQREPQRRVNHFAEIAINHLGTIEKRPGKRPKTNGSKAGLGRGQAKR